MPIPVSQFISLPLNPGTHKFIFYICNYFFFVDKLICTIFFNCTCKQYCMRCVFLFLTSLGTTISRSICVCMLSRFSRV